MAENLIDNSNIAPSAAIAISKLAQVSDHHTIQPWNYSGITAGTWSFIASSAQINCGFYYNSSGTQNDRIDYNFSVSGGTYAIRFINSRDTNRGIVTVLIDGSSVGTVDFYGADARNIELNFTGLALTAGTHTLGLKMATKNGSSSGYYLSLSSIGIWRTGA